MTVKITRNVKVTLEVSPFDMGREFAKMSSDEQAKFFQGIAAETRGWTISASFQWAGLRYDLESLPDGLKVFKEMSEYGVDP